ncbi:hypothetical protein Q2E61_06710 [Microbulbifer thermotolerans]|nr:hypothetical protein [Microbulbifer thermotolerans]WKT61882.1 hypothetical protein Q2E61_06710 [Microbulbifer thermotolerans]
MSYTKRCIFVFPYVTSSKGSISLTSAGEAEVMVLPSGTPSPSTTTIHFEPLPRLVFPTSGPLFLLKQSFRQKTLPPSSAVTAGLTAVEIFSRLLAKLLALPNIATSSSMYWVRDTWMEDLSSELQSVEPKEFLQNRLDFLLALGLHLRALAEASMARLVSIVRPSTLNQTGSHFLLIA